MLPESHTFLLLLFLYEAYPVERLHVSRLASRNAQCVWAQTSSCWDLINAFDWLKLPLRMLHETSWCVFVAFLFHGSSVHGRTIVMEPSGSQPCPMMLRLDWTRPGGGRLEAVSEADWVAVLPLIPLSSKVRHVTSDSVAATTQTVWVS